jgi:V8-like Glu-specific endopeptidase
VRSSFINGTDSISEALAFEVSNKACQFNMTFADAVGGDTVEYVGQGGLLKGSRLTPSPIVPAEAVAPPHKRQRTSRLTFEEFASFDATPVTAKHNLESENGEIYQQTSIEMSQGARRRVDMPDGGCQIVDEIEVRPATEDTNQLSWSANDLSRGTTLDQPRSALTKKPRLFEKVPDDFVLKIGHNVGVVVYRTFDITHGDANAAPNVDLESIYGPKQLACIYAGKVTEISENGETFCHDINTFAGCSGAVVFLLDEQDIPPQLHGKAVGVHVGGLDASNNIGFLLH